MTLDLEYGPRADQMIAVVKQLSAQRGLDFSLDAVENIGRMLAAVNSELDDVDFRVACAALDAAFYLFEEKGTGIFELKAAQDFIRSKLKESAIA